MVARGFDVLNPEGLTLIEQIQLFSQASVIGGMHGAGLTNLLFAPHACLIEFIGEYGGGEYYSLASCLGNDYQRLPCPDQNGNIHVNLKDLASLLESLE